MKPPNVRWSEEELKIAVEAYLYILYMQQLGISCSLSDVENFLIAGPLRGRNDASIRYRMRNISWVLQEQGWPIIKGYSPASGVGENVKKRITKILRSLPKTLPFIRPSKYPLSQKISEVPDLKKNAVKEINRLYDALEGASNNIIGIGHNNPPEALEEGSSVARQLQDMRDEIEKLKAEVKKQSPDKRKLKKKTSALYNWGLKVSLWLGGRATAFTDVALGTLSAAAIAKITGLLPIIADALQALMHLIQH